MKIIEHKEPNPPVEVTVIGTGKKHLEKGTEYSVDEATAKLFVEAGRATYKDKPPKEAKTDKDSAATKEDKTDKSVKEDKTDKSSKEDKTDKASKVDKTDNKK